jgi:hypothetical protein
MKTESYIQSECVRWLWNERPETRGKLFEVNNNPLNKIDGSRRKAMGMVAGVSDLIFLRDKLPPLCIEMKDETGKQSSAQKDWQAIAESTGAEYVVIRNLTEFQNLFSILSHLR